MWRTVYNIVCLLSKLIEIDNSVLIIVMMVLMIIEVFSYPVRFAKKTIAEKELVKKQTQASELMLTKNCSVDF